MTVSQNAKYRVAIWFHNPLLDKHLEEVKAWTQTFAHPYLCWHYSRLPIDEGSATVHWLMSGWQTAVYINYIVLSGCGKEGYHEKCNEVNEPWWQYVEWSKPETKGQLLYSDISDV